MQIDLIVTNSLGSVFESLTNPFHIPSVKALVSNHLAFTATLSHSLVLGRASHSTVRAMSRRVNRHWWGGAAHARASHRGCSHNDAVILWLNAYSIQAIKSGLDAGDSCAGGCCNRCGNGSKGAFVWGSQCGIGGGEHGIDDAKDMLAARYKEIGWVLDWLRMMNKRHEHEQRSSDKKDGYSKGCFSRQRLF